MGQGTGPPRDRVSLLHLFPGTEPAEAGRWHLSPRTVVFLAGYLVLTLSIALTPPSRDSFLAERWACYKLGGLVTWFSSRPESPLIS